MVVSPYPRLAPSPLRAVHRRDATRFPRDGRSARHGDCVCAAAVLNVAEPPTGRSGAGGGTAARRGRVRAQPAVGRRRGGAHVDPGGLAQPALQRSRGPRQQPPSPARPGARRRRHAYCAPWNGVPCCHSRPSPCLFRAYLRTHKHVHATRTRRTRAHGTAQPLRHRHTGTRAQARTHHTHHTRTCAHPHARCSAALPARR